ncbi:MAG: type II toxin-antitoxin system VapC family toxin, partial [Terriglobales bacterium]
VLDASVALCWCFENQVNSYAEAVEAAVGQGAALAAPAVWPVEVGQALARAERLRQMSAAAVEKWVEIFGSLGVEIEAVGIGGVLGPVLRRARRTGLSTYDACYLELAGRREWPLATLDEQLRRAARRDGVALFEG